MGRGKSAVKLDGILQTEKYPAYYSLPMVIELVKFHSSRTNEVLHIEK